MRYVVVGAGAIGGVIAGRLHQHGSEVLLVARGEHFSIIQSTGLTLESPEDTQLLLVPVTSSVLETTFRPDDVVIVAVKGQDTLSVLRDLERVAPPSVAVVCAQNGMENERVALRLFANVYGMCVMCPAAYLAPGAVHLYCAPVSGVLDLGRWPGGTDDVARTVATDLEVATFRASPLDDIATLKWGKLMSNLGNAIEALCGPHSDAKELVQRTRDEATTVLAAHGVDAAAAQKQLLQRITEVNYRPVGGTNRGGGSSWQSLTRGTGDIESDYLNGEIVLLGRLYGVATPVNELLQRRANHAAFTHGDPGQFTPQQLLDELA
jgi:2-dehydropantoate 2-reductase